MPAIHEQLVEDVASSCPRIWHNMFKNITKTYGRDYQTTKLLVGEVRVRYAEHLSGGAT